MKKTFFVFSLFLFTLSSLASEYRTTVLDVDVNKNVTRFGADATGVTNSTAAIQTALNTGRDIHFPRGTYKLSGVLTISNSNQRVTADAGVTLTQTHTNANAITIQHATNVTLSGFKIRMPGSYAQDNYWGGTHTAIRLTNVTHSLVERCHIEQMNFTGIALQSVSDSIIRDNIVEGCPEDNRGLDNNLYDIVLSSCDLLIWGDCQRNLISGNKFKSGSSFGVFMAPIRYTLGGATDNIGELRFENNEVSNHTRYGICGYRANTWTNINDNLGPIYIEGNHIFDIWGNQPGISSQPETHYGAGVFSAGWQDWNVIGNTVSNCTLFNRGAIHQQGGIVIQWNTRYKVMNNDVVDCWRAGIVIDNLVNTHTDQGVPSGIVSGNNIWNTGWITNQFSIEAGSTLVTFSNTNFMAGDTNIILIGAGAAGANLTTGLSNYVSGTTYNTYHAASTSVTNGAARLYTEQGLLLREASYAIIADNNIAAAHNGGFYAVSGTYLTLNGNAIRSGDGFTPRGYQLINMTDCTLDGNSAEGTYQYGFLFDTTCRHMTISGNRVASSAIGFSIDDQAHLLSFDNNLLVSVTTGYSHAGSTNLNMCSNPNNALVTTPFSGTGMLLNVSGAGVPAVSNLVGSVWRRTDGSSASEVIYVGTGGTNWTAK